MSNQVYTLKISPQGQLTLPRDLRERLHVQPGSRVAVSVSDNGVLRVSDKPPIAAYFGTLKGAWLDEGEDATEYARKLRNDMQPRL
jgi:AbrB family looped-hinge helix DNA binding protein